MDKLAFIDVINKSSVLYVANLRSLSVIFCVRIFAGLDVNVCNITNYKLIGWITR